MVKLATLTILIITPLHTDETGQVFVVQALIITNLSRICSGHLPFEFNSRHCRIPYGSSEITGSSVNRNVQVTSQTNN